MDADGSLLIRCLLFGGFPFLSGSGVDACCFGTLEHDIPWSGYGGYGSSQIGQILGWLNHVECYGETMRNQFCGLPEVPDFFRGSPFPGPVKDLAELTDKLWSKSHGLPQATEAPRAGWGHLGTVVLEPWTKSFMAFLESWILKCTFTCFSHAFPINLNGRKRQGLVVRDAAGTGSIRTEPHAACGKAFGRRQICIWVSTAVVCCAFLPREDFEMYEDRYIGFLLWTGFAMFGTCFSCCSLSKVQDKRGLNGGVEACMQTFLSSLDRTVQRCYSINYIAMQGTPTGQNRTKTYT